MQYTLLELTQDVLSSMDSDEINSISDTPESQQVVKVIKTVYDDIISRSDLVTNKTLFNLVASNDTDRPVLMSKPETIDRIEWLKYNAFTADDPEANWQYVVYLPPEDFIQITQQYNTLDTDVETFEYVSDNFTYTFTYKNNVAPSYFTSFNDTVMIFDAYDSGVDDTLQSSKTLGYGSLTTTFQESDSFVPNLQPQQFALLLNEAKSLAWVELKQVPHTKAETTARRNWRHLQKTRRQTPSPRFNTNLHNSEVFPNYARRTR